MYENTISQDMGDLSQEPILVTKIKNLQSLEKFSVWEKTQLTEMWKPTAKTPEPLVAKK